MNFIEEPQKVFDFMHVADDELVELVAYQLKGVSRTSFDQWKEGRDEDAPLTSWAFFEEALLRHFIHKELKEDKV